MSDYFISILAQCGGGSEARIHWRGPLTERTLRNLIRVLELQASFLAESESPAVYTTSETERILRQIESGNESAREMARERGYKLHPTLRDETT